MSAVLLILPALPAMAVLDYYTWKGVAFLMNRRVSRMARRNPHGPFQHDTLLRLYLSAGVLVTVGILLGLIEALGKG